jgi:hypothetical protein
VHFQQFFPVEGSAREACASVFKALTKEASDAVYRIIDLRQSVYPSDEMRSADVLHMYEVARILLCKSFDDSFAFREMRVGRLERSGGEKVLRAVEVSPEFAQVHHVYARAAVPHLVQVLVFGWITTGE